MMVPNAEGVEYLRHAELSDCKVHVFCHVCLQDHTEWFATTEEIGIEVIVIPVSLWNSS
jgi:T5orf172 domain